MRYYTFFFFKQKTAYEMRISDWSSDVCSSDLVRAKTGDAEVKATVLRVLNEFGEAHGDRGIEAADQPEVERDVFQRMLRPIAQAVEDLPDQLVGRAEKDEALQLQDEDLVAFRSEERRVGEEGVSKCKAQ